MKIAVVAANGNAGSRITNEALQRGFDVTAIGRGENRTNATTYIQKDILDLTKEDLAGFDAVVDAFGAFTPDTLDLHTTTSQHLADLVSGTATRLVIVGGAGSLFVDESKTTRLLDTPDFPEEFYALAKAQSDQLDALRRRDDAQWTFISPAADFQLDGPRTGKVRVAGEVLTLSSAGESVISYDDYATALVDELAHGDHRQQRISVVNA